MSKKCHLLKDLKLLLFTAIYSLLQFKTIMFKTKIPAALEIKILLP